MDFLSKNVTLKFLLENALFSIAPICALLSARSGSKQAWLKCEIAIFSVLGVTFILKPECLLSYVLNSQLDKYHYYLTGLYGCYLIFSVLSPYYLLYSYDESVFYGHFWAKIISNTLIIADNIVSYAEGIHWNYKLFCLFTSIYITDLLINACFLCNTKKPWARHPYHDRVNYIARIDTYIFLIAGIIMYAFPDGAMRDLNKSNESYRSLCRACGAILLSLSCESYCMSEFMFIRDKKNFMFSRLTGSAFKTLLLFYAYYWLSLFSFETFMIFLTLNASYNLLVLYGYLITPKSPNAHK